MEISLSVIREVLRSAFGKDSFIAAFITCIEASDACPTASITANGHMRYNPRFVREHVASREDLFCVVVHELMHPMFGHFVYQNGELENIAADMVINATISQVFSVPSGEGTLFRKFYRPEGIEGLLRPRSCMRESRYRDLYEAFYGNAAKGKKLSTGEVINSLRILTPEARARAVILLGGHGCSARTGTPGYSAETPARIAQDFQNAMSRGTGNYAGFSDELRSLFCQVLKTHLSLRKAMLQGYLTRRKVDRFKQIVHQPRIGVSPIPIHPSKRDLVLLSAGVLPLHFHNRVHQPETEERGLAVYLDVSGSVNAHLPKVLGLLQSLASDLKTIFLFSNQVIEVTLKTLLQGNVRTTYGTDFDCIAEHALDNRLDKAVILTDGYASLQEDNQAALKRLRLRTLTVLFGGKTDCPEFGVFGDVLQLEDVSN